MSSPDATTISSSINEVITAEELARRWHVTTSWVEKNSRKNYTADPIPCTRLGRTVVYEWGSPEMLAWWARRSN